VAVIPTEAAKRELPPQPPAETPKGEPAAASTQAPPSPPAADAAPAEALGASAESLFVPYPEDEGGTKVVVTLRPLDAKVYYKGREVGGSPFTLSVKPGKRRNFEVVRKGYLTRKLRVDGSKTEMVIGLRPASAAPARRPGERPPEGSPP
jgi:hypothetical protein